MGTYLLKPDLETDFYIHWSAFVDDALSWGDREFMLKVGVEEERLERADERGTSAYWFSMKNDGGEVWKQEGWLAYSKMEDFFNKIGDLYPGDAEIPENLLELHPELKDYLEELDA